MRFAIIFAIIGLAAAAPQKAPRTIIDSLGELEQTTILDLIELAGLTDALNGEGPFTAFIPKQEVLDNLPQPILDLLLGDPELLATALTYHVAAGSFLSSDLADEVLLPTVQGTDLRVNIYDVDGTTIATVNGVPIDLNSVDIDAGNGVIHLLDNIILNVPAGNTVESLAGITADEEVPFSFEALLYAAEALGLVETINEGEGLTLLAPLDSEGFSVEIVDQLLADPDTLTAILLDHVYDTTIFSIGIGQSREFVSFGGNTLVVTLTDDRGYVVTDTDGNELADVIAGDISTTQGVIHVLDRPIILG